MNNYGSEVEFFPAYKGIHKNVKYQHIASTNHKTPNLIKLRVHPNWNIRSEKWVISKLIQVCSHEPIHNIITHDMVELTKESLHGYDIVGKKFKKQIKNECPKTHVCWLVF